jgi:hypothetical protein
MKCNVCEVNKDSPLWRKALSFFLAVFSKRNKKLGQERFDRCCSWKSFPWDEKVVPCEHLKEITDKGYFCNECGCPQSGPLSYFSELRRKTTMEKATCPMDRWDI